MSKVSVIGAGNVGAFIAYEIASRGIADEIVIVDILKDLAIGQAADIQQALPFKKNKTKVYSGEYENIAGSEIIVMTAGKPRTPDMQDRLMLAEINLKITKSITEEIKKYAPEAIIITIANPMDIINKFIHKQGFPREKVIGMGGPLDSSRLRVVLGHPKKEIKAYILGEHGANQVPIFSKIKIDGERQEFTYEEKEEIKKELKVCSLKVIGNKGATVFAPASNTADMVESILKDQKKVMACSVNLDGEYNLTDVSLGVPVVLGKEGIEKVEIWDLEETELKELQEAGQKLKEFYRSAAEKE